MLESKSIINGKSYKVVRREKLARELILSGVLI